MIIAKTAESGGTCNKCRGAATFAPNVGSTWNMALKYRHCRIRLPVGRQTRERMSHNCGTSCKRKTGERCDTCRVGGGHVVLTIDPASKKERREHATPIEVGAAVDMYYDGLSYRRVAENIDAHFGRKTNRATIYRWVQEETAKAKAVVEATKVDTGPVWVADEIAVKVNGKQHWIFNVMDAKTRFILSAYLTRERGKKPAATALALARERSNNAPKEIKTDGLRSYISAVKTAFPTHPVKHVVSQGIRAEINNNLSERLQGTFRDRDKTLRGLKSRESGQVYVDGMVINYNYFRPHMALKGKRPAEEAGAELPFDTWRDVANMKVESPA